ncbi:MAG: hypothetical protein LBV74_02415 [Tannerella sp.]|nr:hypothetical protein [Tannerella sp.]
MERDERKQQLLQMSKDDLVNEVLRLGNEVNVLKITKGYDERDKNRMKDILTSVRIILEAYNRQ